MEKAGLIGLVRMKYIESDDELSMRGETLLEAITQDRTDGLLPFFVSTPFRNFVQISLNCIEFLLNLSTINWY